THIGYVLEKMKNMFKVDVDILDQKIVYRETIRSKGEGHGRHKKQSGGAGQFGEVFIRFEPCAEDFIFQEEIVGGAVPKNYFPAVEKGLIETMEKRSEERRVGKECRSRGTACLRGEARREDDREEHDR